VIATNERNLPDIFFIIRETLTQPAGTDGLVSSVREHTFFGMYAGAGESIDAISERLRERRNDL